MNRRDRIIQNLLVAQAMVKDLPSSAFTKHLAFYATSVLRDFGPHTCGAAACFGGWVAQHPYFKELGIQPDSTGAPTMRGKGWGARAISLELFGDSFMFDGARTNLPEKQEVLQRIENALNAALEAA